MRRRDFINLLGGVAAGLPLTARAQQSGRMRRVGVLEGVAEDSVQAQPRRVGFQQGLERLGWVEGRNVRFDYRYGTPAGVFRDGTGLGFVFCPGGCAVESLCFFSFERCFRACLLGIGKGHYELLWWGAVGRNCALQ